MDETVTLLEKLKTQSPDQYRHLMGLIKSLVRSQEPPTRISQARQNDLPALKLEVYHGVKTIDRTA
jgi:hypothetical protein